MGNRELSKEEKFLYAIGVSKRTKENFLSDILWAKCLYNKEFLNDFFSFCFPSEKQKQVYSIEREISFADEENGRNDFRIYTNNSFYIVESKILDENISNYKIYLKQVENNEHKIAYIISSTYKGESYQSIIKKLCNNNITTLFWEDFIKLCKDKFKDFAIIASAILNYDSDIMPQKPSLDELKKEKELCDDFCRNKLEKDMHKSGGKTEEWERENGYAYGYTIWASVWFGIMWCPIKGVFFAFGYGKGGNKVIDCDACNFKHIKPLGRYMKGRDSHFYYEINQDKEITEEIIHNAFKEFASIIKVCKDNKEIPLLEFINYGTNI